MKLRDDSGVAVAFNATRSPVALELDDFTLPQFVSVAAGFGQDSYGYVVTPNVDHIIRYHESAEFRDLYASAAFTLLDSRVAAILFRLTHRIRIPVCPGSDLTAALFDRVVRKTDKVVLIGATAQQADQLRARYGLESLLHYNPPMGFIADESAVEACLRFIESASPFRFCLIAVGSPRQEILAQRLAKRGLARGLALCVGASIDFLTGAERRAPVWMRRVGLEWLFRLIQNPRRLAGRYLVRGPKFFAYIGVSRIRLRPTGALRPGTR